MPFKRFDAATCQGKGRCKDPFLRITSSGTISFSSGAIGLLNLTTKSQVAFFNNDESPDDWYMILGKSADFFSVRFGKTGDRAVIQNAFLTHQILAFDGNIERRSMRCRLIHADIKIEDQPAYLLITSGQPRETDRVQVGTRIEPVIEEIRRRGRKPYNINKKQPN